MNFLLNRKKLGKERQGYEHKNWCSKNMNNLVLSLTPKFTKLQSLVLRLLRLLQLFAMICRSWTSAKASSLVTKLDISGAALEYLVSFCPKLKVLNLCRCLQSLNLGWYDSCYSMASRCVHLRSLGLYCCQNITDRAMYSSGEDGLKTLYIRQCSALTPPAVQALFNTFPSLLASCLNLSSVHCACVVQAHHAFTALPPSAH
ncbi:hypothetical protein UlMin_021301 [Ulmus minor]